MSIEKQKIETKPIYTDFEQKEIVGYVTSSDNYIFGQQKSEKEAMEFHNKLFDLIFKGEQIECVLSNKENWLKVYAHLD